MAKRSPCKAREQNNAEILSSEHRSLATGNCEPESTLAINKLVGEVASCLGHSCDCHRRQERKHGCPSPVGVHVQFDVVGGQYKKKAGLL